MSKTLLENGLPMSQAFFGMPKLISHVGDISTAEILEFTSLSRFQTPSWGLSSGHSQASVPDAAVWQPRARKKSLTSLA